MMKVDCYPYKLKFRFEAGTSRGVLKEKDTYFLKVNDAKGVGRGECSPIWGLSLDDKEGYNARLTDAQADLSLLGSPKSQEEIFDFAASYASFPSIQMGVEMALLNLLHGGDTFFHSSFPQKPIPINGLVWMGGMEEMRSRAFSKVKEGFEVIKLKIGALHFEEELGLLQELRSSFPEIVIRVDANGGFSNHEIREVLQQLRKLNVHSIEQPIAAGNIDDMAALCKENIVPVALDEELIGCANKEALLNQIHPQYLILKPSLLGGFGSCAQWIEQAAHRGIEWWTTSALESNLGLCAIAQFTSAYDNSMVHGLGTGSLYTNNIDSPLEVKSGYLWYDQAVAWDFSNIH